MHSCETLKTELCFVKGKGQGIHLAGVDLGFLNCDTNSLSQVDLYTNVIQSTEICHGGKKHELNRIAPLNCQRSLRINIRPHPNDLVNHDFLTCLFKENRLSVVCGLDHREILLNSSEIPAVEKRAGNSKPGQQYDQNDKQR